MIKLDNVDFSGLDNKLRQIQKLTKEVPADLIKQEARLLCVELVKYTQPFGTDAKARQLGETAIKGDLLGGQRGDWHGVKRAGIFYVIPDALASKYKIEKSGRVRLFARKDGKVYGTDSTRLKVNASISELEEFHTSQKNKDGTVGSAGTRTIDNGRWKFIQRWVIKQSQFDALLKLLIQKVGFAKGGWATCAKQLGGLKNIPAWVSKHNTPATVTDNTSAENPSITISNDVNYTSQVLSASGIKGALRDREVKLTSRLKSILGSKFHALNP